MHTYCVQYLYKPQPEEMSHIAYADQKVPDYTDWRKSLFVLLQKGIRRSYFNITFLFCSSRVY